MEDRIKLSRIYVIACLIMIAAGLLALFMAFRGDPVRGWANVLLNNVYFVSLAAGALLFLSIQRVTHSGWSAGFIRVPEAMAGFLPVAAILFLAMIPGVHSLYHWSHQVDVAQDPLLSHKAAYLNLPFWIARMVLYFALWTLLYVIIRRLSLKEDAAGSLEIFRKLEHRSKIYIFIVIISFSFAMIDWVMSIDAHWYSTIFAIKDFVAAFHHAAIVITFIVLLMNRKGYFPFLNKSHLGDFSRYIFMLCIIWGYFWFAEFMLIWYANIPEETAYFIPRMKGEGWQFYFYANIAINWALPFVLLMPKSTAKNMTVLKMVIPVLIIGQFIDLYIQVFPGTVGKPVMGFQEIGTFVGYAGLFMLVTGWVMSRASLYPVNHPYLEECRKHHT